MSQTFPMRQRLAIEVPASGEAPAQVAHLELVLVRAGELPFVSCLDDFSGLFVSPALTRLRDVVRLWSAIRDLSVHLGTPTGRRMVEALIPIDATVRLLAERALAFADGVRP